MSIGRSRFTTRGQNAVSFRSDDKRLGPISNAIILVVLLCLIGLVYLTQVTRTNAYSYQISELQTKQSQLLEEQKDLELTAARLKASDTSSASNGLVSVAPSGTISSN